MLKAVLSKDVDINNYLNRIIEMDEIAYPNFNSDKQYELERFNANRRALVLLFDEDKLIGYMNYLCIKKEFYAKILNSDILYDDNINVEDICEYSLEHENYILMLSMVISSEYRGQGCSKIIWSKFFEDINDLIKSGYKVNSLIAQAVTPEGARQLCKYGFKNVRHTEDFILYIKEDMSND